MSLRNHHNTQRGIALITALLMLLLLLSLSVGFTLLVTSEQRSNGVDLDRSQAFYAAYGAMEQLNAAIGTLFNSNYAPSGAQISAQTTGPTDINGNVAPPNLPGVTFFDPTGVGTGYSVTFPADGNGNPRSTTGLITQGQYQGFQGLITDYTITISAQSANYSLTTGGNPANKYGSEIRLRRSLQTVAIPVFQFGIFSQTDLSFFPGPNFNFGGVVATNGNLYLATGATLTLSAQTSAFGDVIRDRLSNGYTGSAYQGSYGGNVSVTTSPGSGNFRNLAFTEGSINGGPSGGCPITTGASPNSNWTTISVSNYNSNLRNGAFGCSRGTGAKNLQLPLVSAGATGIDLIKLPPLNEDTLNPSVYAQRYFTYPTGTSYAMLRIMIADTIRDITNLPGLATGTPVSMTAGQNTVAVGTETGRAQYLPKWAMSQGGTGSCTPGSFSATINCGDWFLQGWSRLGMGDGTTTQCSPNPSSPTTCGPYIKIEYQDSGTGGWTDVTTQILQLGYVGRNVTNGSNTQNVAGLTAGMLAANSSSGLASGVGCFEPHPNAVIRLQRVADVPSNYSASNKCGYASGSSTPFPTSGSGAPSGSSGLSTDARDYIPMVLFDAREGLLRDCWTAGDCPTATNINLAGAMSYVEVDVNNLSRWFTGAIGSKGAAPANTTGYLLYFSDRRGNQIDTQNGSAESGVNCAASQCKLGNLGWEDFVNPSSATGAPNNTMDTGEDVHGGNETIPGQPAVSLPLETYGGRPAYQPTTVTCPCPLSNAAPSSTVLANGSTRASGNTIKPGAGNTSAGTGTTLFTGVSVNEARVNAPLFFRRALKLTDAQSLSIGNCPGTTNQCGLTITSENPVYVEGNYNAPGGNFAGADTPSAILADAVTLLSKNWNDINSFTSPYADSGRAATTSYYRLAILGGKGISFPQPTTGSVNQDFGTDGGVHNFLRYIENWSGQTLNYSGSLVSFFFSQQAVGTYKDGAGAVYDPPSRGYNFDTNFLTPALLPPRTPTFRDINTLGFTQLIMPNQQ